MRTEEKGEKPVRNSSMSTKVREEGGGVGGGGASGAAADIHHAAHGHAGQDGCFLKKLQAMEKPHWSRGKA